MVVIGCFSLFPPRLFPNHNSINHLQIIPTHLPPVGRSLPRRPNSALPPWTAPSARHPAGVETPRTEGGAGSPLPAAWVVDATATGQHPTASSPDFIIHNSSFAIPASPFPPGPRPPPAILPASRRLARKVGRAVPCPPRGLWMLRRLVNSQRLPARIS